MTQRAWATGRAFRFFFQGEEAARLALARNHQEDQLAAQRREAELRLATNKIENAKTTAAIQTAEEDARKVELRKKASETSVQVKLAPAFIQKSYWQIKVRLRDGHRESSARWRCDGRRLCGMAGLGIQVRRAFAALIPGAAQPLRLSQ